MFGTTPLLGCLPPPEDLSDNPLAYIESAPYRRGVLQRDLRETTSSYARERLANYGAELAPWNLLPEWDPPSRPLRPEDHAAFVARTPPAELGEEASTLEPDLVPETTEEWVALGRRVFFEYPLRLDPVVSALVTLEGALEQTGFFLDDGAFVGLRLIEPSPGDVSVSVTCAQCHAGQGPDGELTASLANKTMNVGAIQLLAQGLTPGALPPELDSTAQADLDRLGPGRGDVQADGHFNPFAFPDLGGLGDLPLLHHNANWQHTGVATLAIRCETLFITSSGRRHRIPRVLSWALAEFYRSLPPPPPPITAKTAEVEWGQELFDDAGCSGCHVPPLFTSDDPIPVDLIGTDPLATESSVRGTGFYRVPSLRGVAATAPYLHHGAIPDLERFLDPARLDETPGHEFGLDLDGDERTALISFLRSL